MSVIWLACVQIECIGASGWEGPHASVISKNKLQLPALPNLKKANLKDAISSYFTPLPA